MSKLPNTIYRYDEEEDILYIFLRAERDTGCWYRHTDPGMPDSVCALHNKKTDFVDGIAIGQWESYWEPRKAKLVKELHTSKYFEDEYAMAVSLHKPYMGKQNRLFLWDIKIVERGRTYCQVSILAEYARRAAVKAITHFFNRVRWVTPEEADLKEGFWDYLHVGTGSNLCKPFARQITSMHPFVSIQVSLNQMHIRDQDESYLESLESFTGEDMTAILDESHVGQDRLRVQEYVGVIYSVKEDGNRRVVRETLSLGGCFADSRRNAETLMAHDWLGNNWGRKDWCISVFEYEAMDKASGLLHEGALRAELGMV